MRIFILLVSAYFFATCSVMAFSHEKSKAGAFHIAGQEFYTHELDSRQLDALNGCMQNLAEALKPSARSIEQRYECLVSGRASLYAIQLHEETVFALQVGDSLVPLAYNTKQTYKKVMLHYLENFEETVFQLAHCKYDQTELTDILTHYNELLAYKEADTPPVFR